MAVNTNKAFHARMLGRGTTSGSARGRAQGLWLGIGHDPGSFARTARQYDNAALRNRVALSILVGIVADLCSRWDDVGFVDDRVTNLTTAADLDPVHDHRIFDLAVAVNSDVSADHAVVHIAAADDRALGDDRVDRHALAIFPIEDKFRRRIGVADRTQRPTAVI